MWGPIQIFLRTRIFFLKSISSLVVLKLLLDSFINLGTTPRPLKSFNKNLISNHIFRIERKFEVFNFNIILLYLYLT